LRVNFDRLATQGIEEEALSDERGTPCSRQRWSWEQGWNPFRIRFPAEPVPVSAYVGSSKNLKDLKESYGFLYTRYPCMAPEPGGPSETRFFWKDGGHDGCDSNKYVISLGGACPDSRVTLVTLARLLAFGVERGTSAPLYHWRPLRASAYAHPARAIV
jgi:hypothetical protein